MSRLQFGTLFVHFKKEMRTGGLMDSTKKAGRPKRLGSVIGYTDKTMNALEA